MYSVPDARHYYPLIINASQAIRVQTSLIIILCSVFDDDKNGTMDFGEFILATNCTSLSDPQAKVRCFGHYGDLCWYWWCSKFTNRYLTFREKSYDCVKCHPCAINAIHFSGKTDLFQLDFWRLWRGWWWNNRNRRGHQAGWFHSQDQSILTFFNIETI